MNAEGLVVADIVEGTSVDGSGLRTSIYFAGCTHRCVGCHNPQTWAFDAGELRSVESVMEQIKRADFNVTLTGGDPLQQRDFKSLIELCRRIKSAGYTLWCYTGYCYETIVADENRREVLDYIDVLVDGPFVESERDISLRFRGSSNQRLVDVARSTRDNIILWGY